MFNERNTKGSIFENESSIVEEIEDKIFRINEGLTELIEKSSKDSKKFHNDMHYKFSKDDGA